MIYDWRCAAQSGQQREVAHFHYTAWPDFGSPQSPDSFLGFLAAVRQSGALDSPSAPAVVHCSAGIGRSGTFCLVDVCLLLVGLGCTLGCCWLSVGNAVVVKILSYKLTSCAINER